jgi:hypothetical protein
LGNEICLAGLVDELGDIPHGFVNGKVLELIEDNQAEKQTKKTNYQAKM